MNKEDYFKYYIQGSDHYLIPKDVFNELFDEMVNWRKESKELNQKYLNAVADYETTMAEKEQLKKQLKESKDNYNCLLKQKEQFEYIMSKQVDYQGKQKEFIEWLEAMNRMYQNEYKDIDAAEHYNCVLQKYKSIIGDDK